MYTINVLNISEKSLSILYSAVGHDMSVIEDVKHKNNIVKFWYELFGFFGIYLIFIFHKPSDDCKKYLILTIHVKFLIE